MASAIPVPRSYQQTLGDVVSTFSARYGIRRLQVGGAILTAFEAVASSDFRATQDIFNLLDLDDFNRLSGSALAYKAAGEGITKQNAVASTGLLTFTDTRFTKISSTIYAGLGAPPAGSVILNVADASGFPATGTVYIGRSTINFEGPLAYTAKTNVGQYWTLTLSGTTQRFHNLNEAVVVGQGGNRSVGVGTSVGTPTNGRTTTVTFTTTQPAVIPDGEISIANVPIICSQPGIIGNVPAGAIQVVSTPPFPGCTATNPNGLNNGLDIQSDADLLETLRNTKASKSRGTQTAILQSVQGVFDAGESKRVLSASLVGLSGQPSTLYIDDGTGYEEQNTGIAADILMDSASGGEQFFALTALRPIAKAYVASSIVAPFVLTAGCILAVKVGGVLSEHTFNATDFTSIGSATAQEVVSSINADANIAYSARTTNGGTGVAVFARVDVGEDVQVSVPPGGVDANTFFGFSSTLTYTARLYKNDVLLYKDGKEAVLTGAPQTMWASMTSGILLKISVDGTPFQTYTFTDQSFITAGTGYVTLSQTNSVASWATVINATVPGVTASDGGGFLIMTSNRDRNNAAALNIVSAGGADFISAGVFTSTLGLSSKGINSDYTMDRMTAQVKLNQILAAGDTLTVGSSFTRGYLQSASLSTGAVSFATTARLWIAVDASVTVLTPSVVASTTYTIAAASAGSASTTYTASAATAYGTTSSLLQVGDTVICWDPNLNANGVFRIAAVPSVAPFNNFTVERPATATQTGIQLAAGGMVFYRIKNGIAQEVRLTAGTNRQLTDIATEFNNRIANATAGVYRNTFFRITTNNFDNVAGNVILLAADTVGQSLSLPVGLVDTSTVTHRGALISGISEVGTPIFSGISAIHARSVSTTPAHVHSDLYNTSSQLAFELDVAHSPYANRSLYGVRRAQQGGSHFGAQVDRHFIIQKSIANSTLANFVLRKYDAAIVATSIVSDGSTTTVTLASTHNYVIGDLVWVEGETATDANFPAGVKTVVSVPTASSFTYAADGPAATAATTFSVNLWDGTWDSKTVGSEDIWAPVCNYAIGPRDTLNMVLNQDPTSQSYSVPMFRRIKPSTSTYSSGVDVQVVDRDNGNNPLSALFGTAAPNYFQDFWAYMHARTISYGADSTKSTIWRSVRVGPEANNYTIAFVNPSFGDTAKAYDLSFSTSNTFDIHLHMPYGTPRTGLNLQAATTFTTTVSTVAGPPAYKQVVFTYAAPVIAIGALSRTSTTVTATTSTPHGFASGQIVYLTITDANFPAGAKVITVTGASTFTYSEAGTATTNGTAGSVSSVAGAPNFASVAVGDIVILTSDGTNGLLPLGSWRVYASTTTSLTIRVPSTNSVVTQATPQKIGGTGSNLVITPLLASANTMSAYVAYVNADPVLSTIVKGTLLGAGSGTITISTADEYFNGNTNTASGSVQFWTLTDGVNQVLSSNLAASPNTLRFKNDATNVELQSGSDFTNEEIFLVPTTAENITQWLSTPAISGAYATTDFNVVGVNNSVQISSRVLGSSGGVQVLGGQANSGVAVLVSNGENYQSSYGRVLVAADPSLPFSGDQAVALQNTLPTPLSLGLSGASTLQVFANGTVTFGSAVWSTSGNLLNGGTVAITKVGNFVVYVFDNLTSIADPTGQKVAISIAGCSSANQGTFRCVGFANYSTTAGALSNAIWVENPNGVSEIVSVGGGDTVQFYGVNSLLPGDTLQIGYNVGGFAANRGTFTVTALGGSGTSVVVNNVFVPATDTLNANYTTILATEPVFRLIERIALIAPNPNNVNQTYMTFVSQASQALFSKLSPNLGATVTGLDKLNFPTEPITGADGYAISTGLIGQVARVLYGDPNAPTIYPGMVANGATVYISGPNIKRIKISLQIRIRTGLNQQTIINQVQSAVASEVNRIPLGQSVDISRLLRVARGVQGVLSVVPLSPTFNSTSDLIAVQANERPFIYNPSTDVAITIVI